MNRLVTLAACLSLGGMFAGAQTATPGAQMGWHYTLVGSSTLLVDCPVCGRPSIPEPLRGAFRLRLLSSNAQAQVFAVENIRLQTGQPETGFGRRLEGSGQWRLLTPAGQVPRQELALELLVTVPGVVTNLPLEFTNDTSMISRPLPLLDLAMTDTRGSNTEVYHLEWLAAPLREIWFSTVHNFSGGHGVSGSRGDVLASDGRIVRRHGELIGKLGLMPMAGDFNVDALDIAPRGAVWFSLEEDVFSETQGAMYHGDLLSSRGEVVKTYSQLIGAFSPMPPAPNVGLDAVGRLPDGTLVFSVKQSFFSQSIGKSIRPGDLLAEDGTVYRTTEQLLAGFHPRDAADAGLDAVYVWPHGEIWFSTENGFEDLVLGMIQGGDLLSSYGYVVYRNLDLLSPFQPLEDLADFGLDGLYVVTDSGPAPPEPPRITAIAFNPQTGALQLNWEGEGGVFQLEWAPALHGPWQPVQDLQPDAATTLSLSTNPPPMRFYRLRQW